MPSIQFACVLMLALAPVPAIRADDAKAGAVELVPGDDLDAFELVKLGPESISAARGEVRLTGKPNGFLATKKSYRNYILSFEWKFDRPENLKDESKYRGNGGLLIHVVEPLKVWPKSVEVQIATADAGNIFGISGGKFEGRKDVDAQKKAMKPVGEWNRQVVTCRDGVISCVLNGEKVAEGRGAEPAGGRIGWQSEGSPMRLRAIRVQELP